MSKLAARRGMKRQVSPTVAVAAILVTVALVIGAALVIPKLVGPKPDVLAPGLPQGAVKQILGERLGASFALKLSSKGIDGLQIIQVPAGATDGLQVGDVVTSINGQKLGQSLPAMVRATDAVGVGQTMSLEVTRGGIKTTVRVKRGKSTTIEEFQKQNRSGSTGMSIRINN